MFGGEIAAKPEKDYNKALWIPEGMDYISTIGEPKSLKGGAKGDIGGIEERHC